MSHHPEPSHTFRQKSAGLLSKAGKPWERLAETGLCSKQGVRLWRAEEIHQQGGRPLIYERPDWPVSPSRPAQRSRYRPPRRRRSSRRRRDLRRSRLNDRPGEPMALAVLPDGRVLHTARTGDLDGRRHEPDRVRGLRADRRAVEPQPGVRRPALVGQHERPARQDSAHPREERRRLQRPEREPAPARRRAHEARDLRRGLPQPVPHGGRQEVEQRVRGRLLAGCAGARSRAWPAGNRLLDARGPPGQLRLDLLHDAHDRLRGLRLRHPGVPVPEVAEQHRPSRAAGGRPAGRLLQLSGERLRPLPGAVRGHRR